MPVAPLVWVLRGSQIHEVPRVSQCWTRRPGNLVAQEVCVWCVPTCPDCGARKGTRKRCHFQEKSLSWQRMCRNLIAWSQEGKVMGFNLELHLELLQGKKAGRGKAQSISWQLRDTWGAQRGAKQHPSLFPCVQGVGKLSWFRSQPA